MLNIMFWIILFKRLIIVNYFSEYGRNKYLWQRPKSRLNSRTKISEFVGGGKEFNTSEVPTYRDVMRRRVLLQEIREIQ